MDPFNVVRCASLDAAAQALRDHEMKTNSRFVAYKTTKDFGKRSLENVTKILWQDPRWVEIGREEYSGIPFAVLGRKRYDCHCGTDRKKRLKTISSKKRPGDHERYTRGSSFRVFPTKKVNCPAQCVIREICRFPSFKISQQLLMDLTNEFVYAIHDPKLPATGLHINLIKNLPENSQLQQIFMQDKMVAHKYIFNVLLKEAMVYIVSLKTGMSLERAEERCKSTELDLKSLFEKKNM